MRSIFRNNGSNNDMSNRMMPGNMEGANQFPPRSEGTSPSIDSMNRGFAGSLQSPHTPHTPHTPGGDGGGRTPVDPTKVQQQQQQNAGKPTNSAQSSPASQNPNISSDSMGPPRTVPASPNMKSETSPPSMKDTQQQQRELQ